MIGQASEEKQREIIRLLDEQNRHLRALRAVNERPQTAADRERARARRAEGRSQEKKRTKKEKSSSPVLAVTVNNQGKEVGLLKGAFDQCRWLVGLKQDTW